MHLKPQLITLIALFEGALLMGFELNGAKAAEPYLGNSLSVWSILIFISLFFMSLGYKMGSKISKTEKTINHLYFSFLIIFLFSSTFVFYYPKIHLIFINNSILVSSFLSLTITIGLPLFILSSLSPIFIKLLNTTENKTIKRNYSGLIFGSSTLGGVLYILWMLLNGLHTIGISGIYISLAIISFSLFFVSIFFRRIILSSAPIIILFLFSSCKKYKAGEEAIVSGQLNNYSTEDKISLKIITPSKNYPIKEFKINPNGKFEVIITKKTNYVYALTYKGEMIYFTNDGDEINIETDLNDFSNYTIEGSSYSNILRDIVLNSKKLNSELAVSQSLLVKNLAANEGKIKTEEAKTLEYKVDVAESKYKNYIKNIIDTINNDAIKTSLCQLLSMEEDFYFITKTFKKINTEKNWFYAESIKPLIEAEKNKYSNLVYLQKEISNKINLKNEPLQYTLINFWASWCYNSVQDQKYIKQLSDLNLKNLQIININLDENYNSYEKNKIISPNENLINYNDQKGWNSSLLTLVNSKYLPCNILIGNKGEFISRSFKQKEFLEIKELVSK